MICQLTELQPITILSNKLQSTKVKLMHFVSLIFLSLSPNKLEFKTVRGSSRKYCVQRRRLAAGLAFEKRRAQLQRPVLENELKIYSKLSFETVALRPLLIKDLTPIATMSSQHSSKPHVARCPFCNLNCHPISLKIYCCLAI